MKDRRRFILVSKFPTFFQPQKLGCEDYRTLSEVKNEAESLGPGRLWVWFKFSTSKSSLTSSLSPPPQE